jgi:hypothetical protein
MIKKVYNIVLLVIWASADPLADAQAQTTTVHFRYIPYQHIADHASCEKPDSD